MPMTLAAGASTQSRARRPLPPGAVSARTLRVEGVREEVEFAYADGRIERHMLLSWCLGQAGLLWGGGPWPPDIQAAIGQMQVHGAYGHRAEHDLAEALGAVYDGHLTSGDMACRFGMNGSDVCAMAVRIARYATGRDPIASSGYHGHSDCLAHPPALGGIPPAVSRLHHRFEFGDADGMRAAAAGAACVMVEVPAWDDEHVIAGFLGACRDECDRQGIPFVLDEIVTGFRLALGGAAERYGTRPDMLLLGKAMSATGGISALVGDAGLVGLLAEQVFYSGTFFGEPSRCAVAAATVYWLAANREQAYGHLREIGAALKRGLGEALAGRARCIGQPERFVVEFDAGEMARREWCGRMIEQNIMCDKPFFSSLAHTPEHIEQTLNASEKVLSVGNPSCMQAYVPLASRQQWRTQEVFCYDDKAE